MSPRALIVAAALLFGTTGTAQALASAGSPVAVGSARLVVGGTLLALVAAFRGELKGLPRAVALSALGVAAYQLAFFAAVRSTGVAVGTVVTIGSAAILTGTLERLVDRSGASRRWLAATCCAVAGVVLLAVAPGARVDPLGVALALAAAGGYASYAVLSRRMLRRGCAPAGVMGGSFGLAALLLLPVLVLAHPVVSGAGVALALYLGVVPTAVAYLCYAGGLRRVSAAETATLGLVEPLTAAVLGVLVVHEQLRGEAVAGGALVLLGLLVLTVPLPRAAEPVLSEA